jgi:protein-S-isoprenylcysteine O-methyltransferase Ste14
MPAPLLAALPAGAPAAETPWQRAVQLAVRKRVLISVVLFTAVSLLAIFVLNEQPRNVVNWANPWVVAAELMILFGLLLRTWAAGTLRKKKRLATTGPYAWIRNPLYVGSFLMMAGFCILVQDPLSLWLVIGPVAWLYWQAIRDEERTLAAIFPDEWPRYQQCVPRFVPRRLIWPRAGEWSLARWLSNNEHQAWLGSLAGLAGIFCWRLWL